jgi:hypothetical protein
MLLKMLKGPLVKRTASMAAAVLLLSLLIPRSSAALSLSGDSSTYAQSRETSDQKKILGGYEYLDIAVQNIGDETISFHTGGWLRYDLQEAEDPGKRSDSDLQYSYLSFKRTTGNTVVNLGRVMVFEGVAAERVDGMYARTDLLGGFGVSGFAGSPVETELVETSGNNVIYGGRLSQGGELYRIGVSALKEEKNSQDYRLEQGVDLWVHPLEKVDVTGRSSYNGLTEGWMEHAYALLLGPFAGLRLDTTASWINYDDYFYRTTTRAFTLQTGLVEPHEKLRILGEEASYALTDTVTVAADYKNFDYDIAGAADYYGGKLRYTVTDSGGAGVSFHRMDGETGRLRYNEYRIYGYKKLGRCDVTADVLDIAYANPINGVNDSLSAVLAGQYALSDALKLGADFEYSKNPDFDKDIRAFFKVLYHFGAGGA